MCGREKTTDRVMCEECAEKSRIATQETRKYYKSLGLCPRCGKNKLFGDEKNCPECRAKMYEINKKSKKNQNFQQKEKIREYYKKYSKKIKEQGICRRCAKRKVAEGHIYCSQCLIKHRTEEKKRRDLGIDRSERPNYGLCYFCGDPLDRAGRACKACSEKMKRNLPKKHFENKYWRELNRLDFIQKE